MVSRSCVSYPIVPGSSTSLAGAGLRSCTASCSPTATRRCRRTRRSAGPYSFLLESVVGGDSGRRTRSSASRRARSCGRAARPSRCCDEVDTRPPRTEWATRPSRPRARRGAWRAAAGECPRGCRGSGAARSAGSRTTACARSRICRRGAARDLGLPRSCMVDHRHAADLRQPAPDAEGRRDAVRRRGPSGRARVRARVRAHRRDRRSAARRRRRALRPLDPGSAARGDAVPPSSFTREASARRSIRVKEYILAGDAFQVVLSQRFAEPARRREPVRRLSRAARDQPVAVHVPPRVPRGARHRRVARDAGAARRRPRSRCARSPARGRAAPRRRGRRALAAELLADPKELRRAPDADRSRPQRRRPRRRDRLGARRRADGDRALLARHAHDVARRRQARAGQDLARRAARRVPGRHAVGRAEDPRDGDHRRARAAQRGIYGGAVGYVSYTGNLDLAIAIRTLVARTTRIYVQAGAGLVADSVPEPSTRRRVNKARAVLRAVAMARTAHGRAP